jgi:methyl coenzyme M reductase subunit D
LGGIVDYSTGEKMTPSNKTEVIVQIEPKTIVEAMEYIAKLEDSLIEINYIIQKGYYHRTKTIIKKALKKSLHYKLD